MSPLQILVRELGTTAQLHPGKWAVAYHCGWQVLVGHLIDGALEWRILLMLPNTPHIGMWRPSDKEEAAMLAGTIAGHLDIHVTDSLIHHDGIGLRGVRVVPQGEIANA